eukprot:TRINITY_DN10114_c0_g1_i1.p2 TRINITY_DN10114_c0_g1~~TRINITY_DN10114_c0_g1_i1.p2  ORF type:complete len:57 (+),score=0.35 TRINITY_DN10114_c0_g1_i1:24-194(+)
MALRLPIHTAPQTNIHIHGRTILRPGMSDCHKNIVLQQLPFPYTLHQNIGNPLSFR